MEKSLKDQAVKYSNHFAMVLDAPCAVVDLSEKTFYPARNGTLFSICEHCPNKTCKGFEQFAYGCREAYRWDGLYTFHCHQEMVIMCASIANEKGDLAGVGGVICMRNSPQDICQKGVYTTLISSRGFDGMDDYVLERMEIRDEQEKKALLRHLGLIGQILVHEVECRDQCSMEIQVGETMKAAFVYGMILQMNRVEKI